MTNKEQIEIRLKRIANVLLLNASFTSNLGLLNGKMGIAIFFYYYAGYTGNEIFRKYAEELTDELTDEISTNTPVNFEDGLAGIGWGIEYLVKNGFLNDNTDEILEELDNKLISYTPTRNDHLFDLTGLGLYFLKRVQNSASSQEKASTLTNKQKLIYIVDELERRTIHFAPLIEEPKVYSVTWEYPIMLIFLGELYSQNIYNIKVEKIISRLTEPFMKTDSFIPQKHSNRLLLALGIQSLKKHYPVLCTDGLVKKILKGVSRDVVFNELSPDSAFVIDGTMGIAWIYNQLYKLTGKDIYIKENEYWVDKTLNISEVDLGYAGFEIKGYDDQRELGLLKGLAGIGLILNSYQND